MQATPFRTAALLAVFVSVSAYSCADFERPSRTKCADCAGEGGSGNGAGSAGELPGSSGSALSPPTDAGAGTSGADAGGAGGAAAGGAGTSGAAAGGAAGDALGGQSGAGSGMGGAAGGVGGASLSTEGEQLELCARLTLASDKADKVASYYATAIYYDCRVSWVRPLETAQAFNGRVFTFSYNLWGCENTLPVDEFGLVLGTPDLSQGDVNLLIGNYLDMVQAAIMDLSTDERAAMEAALVRLAAPLIADSSVEPSQPACPAGGAGGAGGMGGSP